ncbi:MAG: hypothetical protein DRI65_18835, partial [Chloroflexota bacterium]
MCRLLVLLCFLHTSVALSTDKPVWPVGFSLDHVNTDDGLPQNSVRSVLVDLDGYVWAGTEKGLARFDGQRFINFSELIPDIPEDVSLGLQLDSSNRIWTSWYTNSIRILSANRQDVLVINAAEASPNDLLTKTPPRFIESGNGEIWFPGNKNLYRINNKDEVTSIPLDVPVINAGTIVDDLIVFGTLNGLLLLDPETENTEYISIPGYQKGAISSGPIVALRDSVIFCHTKGVFRYQLNSDVLKQLTGDTDLQISKCKLLGSDLLISSSKPGMESIVISTLNIASGKFTANPAGLPDSADKLLSIGLYDTFVDKDNNRWVLIGRELYRSNGAVGEFRPVELPNKPFGNEDVFAQSLSGAVWLRTDGDGLAKFSRYSQRFQTVIPPATISKASKIRAMAVDSNDNVWLSSDGQKLLYWDRADNTWIDQLPGNTGNIKGIEILPDASVWVILPDFGKLIGFDPQTNAPEQEYLFSRLAHAFGQTPGGRLILATDNNVILMNPHSGARETLNKEPLNGQIRAFEQDDQGNTWVGTHEFGLAKINPSGETQYWSTDNSALSSSKIFSLHFDASDLLWIGTWHGGLVSFNPSTNQFQHYGMDDGLPDSTIFGILEDDAGYLWLSTYDGLVRFKACQIENCKPEVIVFTHHDGLQANEFDADSHFQSSRGELFFAGRGGLNAFYPESIQINQQAPVVKISRIQLNDGPLPGSESEFVVPAVVNLPYGFGNLRLELSVLDFNDPVKNRLQYRDLNVDEAWKDMQQPYLL